MADMIKNRYNRETIYKVAVDIKSVYEAFQIDEFMKSTMDKSWEGLGLKDRIIQISTNLGKYLPSNYSLAIGVIDKVVMNYGDWLDGFGGFFPIFVQIYGQNEADNLNDISKTHPELVIKIARGWYGKREETDWIVKHGCRTLLKNGNRDALSIFGYDDITAVAENFVLSASSISLGDDISFSFTVYVKTNGKRSRKIFKISEVSLKENEKKQYTKKQSFADVSVRKHYAGIHSITLIANGIEQGTNGVYKK